MQEVSVCVYDGTRLTPAASLPRPASRRHTQASSRCFMGCDYMFVLP